MKTETKMPATLLARLTAFAIAMLACAVGGHPLPATAADPSAPPGLRYEFSWDEAKFPFADVSGLRVDGQQAPQAPGIRPPLIANNKPTTVTLKRGVCDNASFRSLLKKCEQDPFSALKYFNAKITLRGDDGKPLITWNVFRCIVTEKQFAPRRNTDSTIEVESLTIECTSIKKME